MWTLRFFNSKTASLMVRCSHNINWPVNTSTSYPTFAQGGTLFSKSSLSKTRSQSRQCINVRCASHWPMSSRWIFLRSLRYTLSLVWQCGHTSLLVLKCSTGVKANLSVRFRLFTVSEVNFRNNSTTWNPAFFFQCHKR